MLKESRYNIIVPLKEGRSLIYNSLTGAMAKWDYEDLKTYRDVSRGVAPSDSLAHQFLKGGFLVEEAQDELQIFNQNYRMDRFNRLVMTLTISPTMACNFGCDYCFQSKERSGEIMSPEVRDKIIDLLNRVKGTIKRLHIAWYGGEPLLKFNFLKNLSHRLLDFCMTNGITYDSMLVTNGYYLTGDIADQLAGLGINIVQVTLDGPREDHDCRRTLLSGGATFDTIIANLKEAVVRFKGIINIRVNVDFRNSENIPKLWQQMRQAGLAGIKNLRIYYAPIEAITEFCHDIASISMTKEDYGNLEARLIRQTYKALLSGPPYPPKHRSTCGAVKPLGFVVNPNGDLYKCWDTINKPECKVGTIFDIDSVQTNPVYKAWLNWNPLDDETCTRCKLLPSCAGGCAFKFLYKDQTLGEAAEIPCISWRYNINEKLLLRAEIGGFITEEDYDPSAVKTDASDLILDDTVTERMMV